MGGGLMQLVAYGAQDIYLTGNPQITFFKVVYRRHTNFAMEAIQQTMNGTSALGGEVSVTISRNGDLVHKMYLEHQVTITASDGTNVIGVGCDYGSHVMKECELEIGGQRIDKHYGHWHSVWSQLSESNPSGANTTLFNKMTGNGDGAQHANGAGINGWTSTTAGSDITKGRFWIPLYFWFCRNPGLALPLIALQYHEVKVKIKFEELKNLVLEDANGAFNAGGAITATATGTYDLWCDYIYLDTDERRRFAQVSHEYLIEQLQYEKKSDASSMLLNFNHPVKELVWSGIRGLGTAGAPATDVDSQLFARAAIADGTYQIKLNGHDRFAARDVKYFTKTQVWQHHTGYGCTQIGDTIGVYSFALKPEEHQPSGTCNFSRIDNAQLIGTGTTSALNVYAVNYNVLRIMSGMGGLAYSN